MVALVGATSALQKGNRTQFNKFLRYRVAAQGLTVVAALGAFSLSAFEEGRPLMRAGDCRWISLLPTREEGGASS